MKHQHSSARAGGHGEAKRGGHYARLYLMAASSFIAMFCLMYAMVDRFSHVYVSLNQFYMAALMTAPMVVIEIALMAMMYPNKRKNALIIGVTVLVGLGCWVAIRQQGAINDAQFLRSMIPHHAGAILMCERLRAGDPEINALCADIIKSQTSEITQMQEKLAKLD